MNEKKMFCEVCKDYVLYRIEEIETTENLKGEDYTFLGKEVFCEKCNAYIFDDEVMDFNMMKLYDEYRKENNIISYDKILEILKKYAIGKRPLSQLLGWGELTYSRYCDGDMPSIQYSEILKKIYNNPNYFLELLKLNKDKISATAYNKSEKQIEDLLGINPESKINLVIDYILSECEDITPLALQKVLYYAQGFYYAFSNEYLFDEDCEAWVHGPVYPSIYHKYKDYKFDPIKNNDITNDLLFTSLEKELLDSIIQNICCYSGKTLEKFTHLESPWLLTRGDLSKSQPSGKIISKNIIQDYFIKIKKKYNMVNPGDIKYYTNTMFNNL